MTDELDDEIDKLAEDIEQTIKNGKRFLEELPAFAPRTDRSRKLRQVFKDKE
jgi:hypothetical protein